LGNFPFSTSAYGMFRDFRRNIASLLHGSPVQQGPWNFRLKLWEKYGTFSHRKSFGIMTQTIENRIVSRIYGHGRGWAFSPVDFRDFGRVDMPLQRASRTSFTVPNGLGCNIAGADDGRTRGSDSAKVVLNGHLCLSLQVMHDQIFLSSRATI